MIASIVFALTVSSSVAGESFDHTHQGFAAFLGSSVSASRGVNYTDLASRRTLLDTYLGELKTADLGGFSKSQKIAFWVNAYNALTISVILDANQPKSILDLDGGKVWDRRTFQVAGQSVTLNDIENKRVRPISDGRIHGALNCASKGCPPLAPKPMKGAGVSAQLDAAARRWVATNAFRRDGDAIYVNKIFDWYGDDFTSTYTEAVGSSGNKESAALRFIVAFSAEGKNADLLNGDLNVQYNNYDWTLNKQ